MINSLHQLLHSPRKGWDPVGADYAAHYAQNIASLRTDLVALFEQELGGFKGKQILDLASGPGQYALEFARRGAHVVCLDVSARYLKHASEQFSLAGMKSETVLSYVDAVGGLFPGRFDGIFNNVSWYYAKNDRSFARSVLRALKPQGVAVINANTEAFEKSKGAARKAIYWLNAHVGWKIGHPHPPRGRIAASFDRLGDCRIVEDYSHPIDDLVVVRKI